MSTGFEYYTLIQSIEDFYLDSRYTLVNNTYVQVYDLNIKLNPHKSLDILYGLSCNLSGIKFSIYQFSNGLLKVFRETEDITGSAFNCTKLLNDVFNIQCMHTKTSTGGHYLILLSDALYLLYSLNIKTNMSSDYKVDSTFSIYKSNLTSKYFVSWTHNKDLLKEYPQQSFSSLLESYRLDLESIVCNGKKPRIHYGWIVDMDKQIESILNIIQSSEKNASTLGYLKWAYLSREPVPIIVRDYSIKELQFLDKSLSLEDTVELLKQGYIIYYNNYPILLRDIKPDNTITYYNDRVNVNKYETLLGLQTKQGVYYLEASLAIPIGKNK